MGLLVDYKVKSREKKFWINLIKDIVLIGFLIYVGLSCRAEWMSGYEYCKERCIVYLEVENVSSDTFISSDFNLSGEEGIAVNTNIIEPA